MQSVKLNVGGHYFTTSLQTLTKDPNSMLAAMFLETFEMKPSEDGAFFIDRDGTHFRFILNYLRTGKLTSPEGEAALKELQEEAEFYQIEGLIEKLKVNPESLTSVKLNVGGHHFTTSLQTLTKDPNSKLATMFSGKVNMKLAEDGAFFIDRDGTHFRFILNYLRTGKLTSPEGEAALKELQEEAEFYQIEGLIEKLKVNSESLTSVKLNVGGHHFTTSLQTLTRDPNSMLAAMFSGKFPMEPHGDGAFFIDRDGTHFRFILNYLRTGKLTFPEGATALAEFKEEADFYQIQGILDELDDTRLKSEILTDEEHRSILVSWLPPKGEIGRRRRYRLLFRASRDGFSAATFHSKCDDKGPTITIVQSGDNKFGGFTDSSWGRDSDENCREAFLFSMVNPFGSAPTKMLLRPDPEVNWSGRPGGKSSNLPILVGILPEAQSGPAFGSRQEDTFRRYDLLISGNANVRDSSSESLGASYQCPEGYKGTFFTGKRSFMVSNYEVFEVFN